MSSLHESLHETRHVVDEVSLPGATKKRGGIEPKQRAHSPLLAAGLASKLKTDYIPYGRRFPARSAAGSFKYVPHRQWVFAIPKRLRVYFITHRRLLSKLSQCIWKVLSAYLKSGVPYDDAVPCGMIAVQAFGDFQNFNPHLHIIATDGCFYGRGSSMILLSRT